MSLRNIINPVSGVDPAKSISVYNLDVQGSISVSNNNLPTFINTSANCVYRYSNQTPANDLTVVVDFVRIGDFVMVSPQQNYNLTVTSAGGFLSLNNIPEDFQPDGSKLFVGLFKSSGQSTPQPTTLSIAEYITFGTGLTTGSYTAPLQTFSYHI